MQAVKSGRSLRLAARVGVLFCLAAPALGDQLRLRPGMGGMADLSAVGCEAFNEMYPAGPNGYRQAVLYWTEGYVYARTGKTMDELLASLPGGHAKWTFETLTGHVVEYCRARPEATVPAAVADLWTRLDGS